MTPNEFQQRVLTWFDKYGRKNLPWQENITPYRVWLSEIMLQQTQVKTVLPYFQAFTQTFPTVESLAHASQEEVLQLWSGLGYYSRARNLHQAAQKIVEWGYFPETLSELMALPGIGQSTAGAILSIAFNKSSPILDGNVKRVLTRFKAIEGWSNQTSINKQLWELSSELTPHERVADYTQAMMDLGATTCTRSTKPQCSLCPIATDCLAYLTKTIHLYPTPKSSKTLPVKKIIFLILHNHSFILLEKRPQKGIWGGLWSLPEFSHQEQILMWCAENGINPIYSKLLPFQRHTFSHYHLNYWFIDGNNKRTVI